MLAVVNIWSILDWRHPFKSCQCQCPCGIESDLCLKVIFWLCWLLGHRCHTNISCTLLTLGASVFYKHVLFSSYFCSRIKEICNIFDTGNCTYISGSFVFEKKPFIECYRWSDKVLGGRGPETFHDSQRTSRMGHRFSVLVGMIIF